MSKAKSEAVNEDYNETDYEDVDNEECTEIEDDDFSESEDDLWEPEPIPETQRSIKRRPRKKDIVIPPYAHPIEAFMLIHDFGFGDIISITDLSKDVLLGIIRGDVPTEYQRKRLRLTTGIKV